MFGARGVHERVEPGERERLSTGVFTEIEADKLSATRIKRFVEEFAAGAFPSMESHLRRQRVGRQFPFRPDAATGTGVEDGMSPDKFRETAVQSVGRNGATELENDLAGVAGEAVSTQLAVEAQHEVVRAVELEITVHA